MSEQLTLREAVPDDAKALLDFLKKASQQTDFIVFDDIDGVTVAQEAEALDAIYQSDYDELIVAILGDEVIGYCRIENTDDEKAEFGVVVDEGFWNNGIASYLMEDALIWAKESPLFKIFLEVYKDNLAAIHVYQKYGFTTELTKEKTLIMEKMV